MKSRILIVEDESIVALDIQTRLEDHGFEVIGIVSSGSRAVEKAITEIPDLILMDINLKGSIDGIETASLIRRRIDTPVIFLTAFADEKTLKKARISDASGYILKPFRENELLITIELAIKRASVKKKIEENSNWLYGTLNNIQDAVLTVSDENRTIFLNKKANELLKNSVKKGEEFIPDDFIFAEGERTYFQFDGKKIDVEFIKTDITDDEKTLLGQVYYIRDISRQVAFEVGLEEARFSAENSNRSKSDFLANVTHELRTPLNTIIGMNYLISEMSTDDEITVMHDLIGTAADKLLHQINDILELTEIEQGLLKVVNSRFSIGQIISEVAKTFKKQIILKSLDLKIICNNIPLLIGDKNKIRDILSALISNAVKFTRNGLIEINGSIEGEILVIQVKDSGIGLTEEKKKIIFELLTQADGSHTRAHGGIGVGLSLVNELLVLLGGSINLESEKLKGCKFTVNIPVTISKDQATKIEVSEPEKNHQPVINRTSQSYLDLITLIEEAEKLLVNENFQKIEKKIKEFSRTHNIMELNFESQILFRLSIAIKLKNKEKFQRIYKDVINESIDTAGGVYENSYS